MVSHPDRRFSRHRIGRAALACLVAVAAACSSAVAGPALPRPTTGPVSTTTTPASTSSVARPPTPTGAVGPPITVPQTRAARSSTGISTGPIPTSRPTLAQSASGAPAGAVGADGIGDPYYPESGNGGYQVNHYDLAVIYTPETNALAGIATITGTVTATDQLGRFNFDLQRTMIVSAVTVNGAAATFRQRQAELEITPAAGLPAKTTITVVVTYGGQPGAVPGGTAGLGDGGWYRTQSGGALAAGEPFSASAWYPANEHPADLATYTITATVPARWSVIANGLPVTDGLPAAPAGMKISRWNQDVPVATYLATLWIDTFTVITGHLSDGRPVISAIAAGDREDAALADDTAGVIDVLTGFFGPYPFKSAGGLFTNESIPFALETATRPVYADWVDFDTVVHELAHQWYGDQTAVQRWSDICINECFASYAPWLYHEQQDGQNLDDEWRSEMATIGPDYWSSPLVDMGPGNEFSAVYTRGPLALHALRKQMGDAPFLKLLKDWPAKTKGTNRTFDQWATMATEYAGTDLTAFINAWFRGTTRPADSFIPADLR